VACFYIIAFSFVVAQNTPTPLLGKEGHQPPRPLLGKEGAWLAFLPALIFLVHPLNTEAVDYVSGRADVMYAFFFCSHSSSGSGRVSFDKLRTITADSAA